MTIHIDSDRVVRLTTIAVALTGVAAGAFFGGQSTRMSDTARAAERDGAVTAAVTRTQRADAATLKATLTAQAKIAKKHERKALAKLHKKDTKAATKQADAARSSAYSAGSSTGYSNGYSRGSNDGYGSGYLNGSIDTCIYDGTC